MVNKKKEISVLGKVSEVSFFKESVFLYLDLLYFEIVLSLHV